MAIEYKIDFLIHKESGKKLYYLKKRVDPQSSFVTIYGRMYKSKKEANNKIKELLKIDVTPSWELV